MSNDHSNSVSPASGDDARTLPCGCGVSTYRDFLDRVVGRVVARGAACPNADHVPGAVVIMPGREHARRE